jgi:hypothetical protein
MFFNKKIDPNPLGVPLGEINEILKSTTLQSKLVTGGMEVAYEKLTAVVSVEEPPINAASHKNIQAVVSIKTYLPKQFHQLMSDPEFRMMVNKMATFAAITQDESGLFLGSRLTIYEDETGWNIYFPLLLYSLIITNEIFNHSLGVWLGQDQPVKETSAWTDEDFELTKSYLEKMCVCTTGGSGFTAEFGIKAGSVTAIAGHQTALWRMLATQPHPALGGGLFCILELPFEFEKEKLMTVVNTLNKAEMLPHDLPPHFGSWTKGNRENNPAYVSFIPNIMQREAKNIQVNKSIWANSRVQSAYATLLSHGYI